MRGDGVVTTKQDYHYLFINTLSPLHDIVSLQSLKEKKIELRVKARGKMSNKLLSSMQQAWLGVVRAQRPLMRKKL